ncbi:flagellar protein FliT [Variovorax sp. WS11]|nr:flagellar protein FliT [Variovorax sp. WS11]PSL79993.1 flagellar protein FliT [Variovorax sp. WS11]
MSLMAALARAKEWDRLPELEMQCAAMIERLRIVTPEESLDPAQVNEAQRLLQRIRADQQLVCELVKPQLAGLVATMADLQNRNELDRAYGSR